MEIQNWDPIQSNPEIMNNLISKFGFNIQQYCVQDVLSIQEWAQDMVPRPVVGVILLYQITPSQSQFIELQSKNLKQENSSKKLFFIKQLGQNSCGTLALFHIILNSMDLYPDIVTKNSLFQQFRKSLVNKNSNERGKLFKNNCIIFKQHKEAAQKGFAQLQLPEENIKSHFISFVYKQGMIYQLDGLKKYPVNHGKCDGQEVLQKSCDIIQKFINRDPQNPGFSILVVCRKPEL